MEHSILHLIRNTKNNTENNMNLILQIFHPLLKSLSLKLEKEDTYQDLSLFLFTLIPKIPLSIDNDAKLLSYIKVSLTHELFRLSKLNRYKNIEIPSLTIYDAIASNNTFEQIENKLILENILSKLQKKDKSFIVEILSPNTTIKEISNKHHVTNQVIYQRYYKLLKKIKHNFI